MSTDAMFVADSRYELWVESECDQPRQTVRDRCGVQYHSERERKISGRGHISRQGYLPVTQQNYTHVRTYLGVVGAFAVDVQTR
jgi:hypothetical protein